jgi:hypothetical protein
MTDIREDIKDEAIRYKELLLSRLETATAKLWPAVESGDRKAITTLVTIMNRQSRLLGLDRVDIRPGGPDPYNLSALSETELKQRASLMGIKVG